MKMKKRKLTKTGKVVFTTLTFILSAIIYYLMGILGELATEGIIYQLALIIGWGWLFIGQIAIYFMIWE